MPDAGDSTPTGGTYTLLVDLPERATVAVGALGDLSFDSGWYAYVGSALGAGGFGRVDRHCRTAAGEHDVRHWHADYFLGETPASVDAVAWTPGADVECAVADRLAEAADGAGGTAAADADVDAAGVAPVPGFGASDCDCEGHLFGPAPRDSLLGAVERAHERGRR